MVYHASERHSLLQVNESDDVASALRDIAEGESIDFKGRQFVARSPVPRGHKIALHAVRTGEILSKFGWPIGTATKDIAEGEHVHSHNLSTMLSGAPRALSMGATTSSADRPRDDHFMGYRRQDGSVGTRNEIWILCTVGCVSNIARRIADRVSESVPQGIDGVYAFPHPFGCSQLGGDLAQTRRLLASLACNPNAGGVLIVGLGCENNQLDALLDELPSGRLPRVRSFAAQSVGDEVGVGVAAVEELITIAKKDARTRESLGKLVIGLKCGGSDGLSGLTANPLVGDIASWVDSAGGTPVLTEIPEIFGAEHILFTRARDRSVSQKAQQLVDDFKRYFTDHGEPVHENPSPGNKAGGITTLEEKSLGAVQKAGTARLAQVLRYGERVSRTGLALLEAPGNDAVSSTALAAAGATLIIFTTGRGTPMGFPVPTFKIASNSDLARTKPHWIDFDAGCLIDGVSREDAADMLLAKILVAASGAKLCAERNGEREIAIWKQGVTV